MTRYALLSVYNKKEVAELAKTLNDLSITIIATGGTAKELEKHSIPFVPIQKITGNPESFDGRIKTISFQIEGGILYDRQKETHRSQAQALNVPQIDIVVCNLYPFEETIAKNGVTQEEAIEQIDVGGPTMIRSAAKNFKDVLVITDPNDYDTVTTSLRDDNVTDKLRKALAAKAFAHLSLYDSQIAKYLEEEEFPNEITLPGRLSYMLRYGENPHQQAAVYFFPNNNSPLQKLEKKWGRDLSYLNITDIFAGLESVRLFTEPAAVVIKHNSPSGIALGETRQEALSRAIDADPESAFGGIIVVNKEVNRKTADVIGAFKDERKSNIDIVAAPAITDEALNYLQKVRKTMGIYTFGVIPKDRTDKQYVKYIDGGFILQTWDGGIEESFSEWKVVTDKKPSEKQLQQMKTAWKFLTRIRSNAVIVVDKEIPMTRGIGSGQTSRVRSAKIALEQAGNHTQGAILASDSFFPFDDAVKLAQKAGIFAIVQQGGSINDRASITAANQAGIVMIFTHRRAFWH